MWIKNHVVLLCFDRITFRGKKLLMCKRSTCCHTPDSLFSSLVLYQWTHGGVVATEWSGTKTSPLLSCSVATAVSPRSWTPSSSSDSASTASSPPRSPRPPRRPVRLQGAQRPGATARSPGPAGGRVSGTPAQTSGLQRNTITSQTNEERNPTITEKPGLVLTRVQQVGILVSQSLVSQEVVPIFVEGKERHHVVAIIVANRSIGLWVARSGRLVGPEPAFVDTAKNKTINY